jgi:CheY-like chemotaxis protein
MYHDAIKILMADDDPEDLELIEEHIRAAKPEVQLVKFTDGLSALENLLSLSEDDMPSIIILDYNMPGLTGSQVLSQLKDFVRYEDIPKVVLSSSNTDRYIRECLSSGAWEYIVKPDNMNDLARLGQKLVSMAIDQGGGKSKT